MPTLDMIQQAVHQAVAEYPVKRVELFGSYANGTADADSDVDFLVVVGSYSLPDDYRIFLHSELLASN